MQELTPFQVQITDDFWEPRLKINAERAIWHQWDQLERSGCIDNFRLVAGEKEGFREGWFFADSDAFKWLDAASRIYATRPTARLKAQIDTFVRLIGRAQSGDGYLYTYNQLHFPGQRWLNLQIEHELYCHGHLIEAAVSHFQATGERTLLSIGERAAGLLVGEFMYAGPDRTPGHQEIELALIRLSRVTGNQRYLELARRLVERRGRNPGFTRHLFQQTRSVTERSREVSTRRKRYLAQHPGHIRPELPPGNVSRKPRGTHLRFLLSTLSGKYMQQHRPIREQAVPVGHAVRFAYLEAATAMLVRELGDTSLLPALEKAWSHLVQRRMYVTGGVGALPGLEGFGRDYELDPEAAYAETCAALGCLFWSWEMALITRQAWYADLFEWQLYNAASVGTGLDGTTYLYNNPLASCGGITRRPWFRVPCCPPNLSRTWASIGHCIFSCAGPELWLHQTIGCQAQVDLGVLVSIEVESRLPWEGRVTISVEPASPAEFTLHLRIPSWARDHSVTINGLRWQGEPSRVSLPVTGAGSSSQTASGYTPFAATYLPITRRWAPGDRVDLEFPMQIVARRSHPRVRSTRDRIALTRGPLVYCLESIDNPGLNLFDASLDLSSLQTVWDDERLGGLLLVQGRTTDGQPFTAIPYYAWANRGESQMVVMARAPAKG